MQPKSWVIGSLGLLGGALTATLESRYRDLFQPSKRFEWNHHDFVVDQIRAEVARFAKSIIPSQCWEIYWAAGPSTMHSPLDSLTRESNYLSTFLEALGNQPQLLDYPGSFCFSSSAGAIYSGSSASILNEESSIAPTTDYGRQKLIQEELVSQSKLAQSGTSILLARISNLYGIQDSNVIPKGLISILTQHVVHRQPTNIFVPLDTLRDYIWSQDAAEILVESLKRTKGHIQPIKKIVSSEHPTTVAELIRTLYQLTHTRPRYIHSFQPDKAKAYQQQFRFQSIVYPDLLELRRTSLRCGLSKMIAAIKREF